MFSAGTKGTKPVVVFAALALEKTGEWGGSSYVPTPQKSTLPDDLCDLHLSILLLVSGICVRVYSLSHD